MSDSGAGPYSMLPNISFTAGLVTFFTLSIASPGQGQGVTVYSSSRGDSYLISVKDLLLRVLAVEDEARLCHILSCCLHVWAGGGGRWRVNIREHRLS